MKLSLTGWKIWIFCKIFEHLFLQPHLLGSVTPLHFHSSTFSLRFFQPCDHIYICIHALALVSKFIPERLTANSPKRIATPLLPPYHAGYSSFGDSLFKTTMSGRLISKKKTSSSSRPITADESSASPTNTPATYALKPEDRMNLAALKRHDPYVSRILESASQVALYLFNEAEDVWAKSDVEGTLFAYERSAAPFYGFTISNRKVRLLTYWYNIWYSWGIICNVVSRNRLWSWWI